MLYTVEFGYGCHLSKRRYLGSSARQDKEALGAWWPGYWADDYGGTKLLNGWEGPIIIREDLFAVLDGIMIFTATTVFNIVLISVLNSF